MVPLYMLFKAVPAWDAPRQWQVVMVSHLIFLFFFPHIIFVFLDKRRLWLPMRNLLTELECGPGVALVPTALVGPAGPTVLTASPLLPL